MRGFLLLDLRQFRFHCRFGTPPIQQGQPSPDSPTLPELFFAPIGTSGILRRSARLLSCPPYYFEQRNSVGTESTVLLATPRPGSPFHSAGALSNSALRVSPTVRCFLSFMSRSLLLLRPRIVLSRVSPGDSGMHPCIGGCISLQTPGDFGYLSFHIH